ncbi:hypothetical protein Cpir12675_006180 [Ceratocystis pirilliformis]|uniref:Uncharacterized protein n=1 Tax=Ceratocystis pirilliformis TaxID=259994 RepID=A0ABR3YJJ4_9PEZI
MRFPATFTALASHVHNSPRAAAPEDDSDDAVQTAVPDSDIVEENEEDNDDDEDEEDDNDNSSASIFDTATLSVETVLGIHAENFSSNPSNASKAYYAWIAAPVFFVVLLGIIGSWEFFFFQRRKKHAKPTATTTPSAVHLLGGRPEMMMSQGSMRDTIGGSRSGGSVGGSTGSLPRGLGIIGPEGRGVPLELGSPGFASAHSLERPAPAVVRGSRVLDIRQPIEETREPETVRTSPPGQPSTRAVEA